ncbi:hypothetical protein BFJ70_g17276 [Fusarium oxysporum]|nr:hypothetical protein BFJ70_g17276 [Fusarium oxysporum]
MEELKTQPLQPTAKKYAISRGSLRNRQKGGTNARDAQIERQKLSEDQEEFLVEWILNEEAAARAPTKKNVRLFGNLILKYDNQDQQLGNHWVNRFLTRHPDIKMKLSRSVDAVRTRETTEEQLERFYKLLARQMEEKNVGAGSLHNIDKHGVAEGETKKGKVIGSSYTPYSVISKSDSLYTWPSWNTKNALRAGSMKAYLPLAQKRENFTLRLGSKVIRVVRSGSKATGVKVKTAASKKKIIKLSKNGRAVLSAGALTTPRLLFNSERNWIELPVGENLIDHPIFSFNIKTGGAYSMLDTDSALNGSDTKNIKLFKSNSQKGSDGVTRYFHGSYAKSIIDSSTGFEFQPPTNTSAIIASSANGNHYAGTAKMGTDDGRKGGSSVVDTNAKVYGMDNLFISDASINPDLPTGNIQTIVMVATEAAVAKILAC